MTIVNRAGRAMRQTHKTLDPVSVTCYRDDSLAFTAIVTIGETQLDEVTTDNTVVTSRQRSFFVDAINYDFGNGPVEPEQGDRFETPAGPVGIDAVPTTASSAFPDRPRTYAITTPEPVK